MAEDSGIEGLLGSEPDERELESAAPSADGVALSLALQKADQNPELSRSASEYLVEQRRLVQLQIKHFDEEHRLAIGFGTLFPLSWL